MPALRRREPGFTGLAAIICGQQLSTASAAAIWGRLTVAFDPFDHDMLLRARANRLGRLGLSAAKIKTLKSLAREIAAERLNLDILANEDADAAHHTLTSLHGIGPWTADVYLLFCLGHGDAWPAGDLAVQEAVKIGLGLKTRPNGERDGAAGGTVAPDARRRGASVVDLLQDAQEARGRDRGNRKSERCFKQSLRCKTVIGEREDRGSQTAGIEKMKSTDFIVARDDLPDCKFIETQLPDVAALPDEALLIKIDRFAFTANNITYALTGDQLKYWHLFPAPENFGNIPVWGFGEVIASNHPGIDVGERLFGYFPMATHLVIEAADVSTRSLRDAAAHRQSVSPVYNAYARVSGNPAFAGREGDYQALLRPLFMLSFLVDDFLNENDFFGARSVILSSASSKAAFGLAHLLHTARKGIRVIGLTSATNVAFVQSLGCYDEVLTYDRATALPPDSSVVFVDMAGNSELRARLHRHFGDRMKYSGRIGLTHGRSLPEEPELPGARPTWFFAPDQILQTRQGMGAAWHRYAIWRGMVGLRPNASEAAHDRGRPRACGSEAGLSRHAQRAYSAGAGPYAVARGLTRFLRDLKRYSVAAQETPRRRMLARSPMLDRTDDLSVSAENWLAQFERALASPGDGSLKTLLHPDSHWRDVLALSWNLQTINGASAILRELQALADRAAPRTFRIDPDRAAPRRVARAGTEAIEAIFKFETRQGRGSGILRLIPDAADGNKLKAWTLLTALDELKGFEEPLGSARPRGQSYSRDFRGPNWLDLRKEAAAYADRDPVVLVVGGGQAGLSIAARCKQLQIDTLVVDREARIGDNWRKRYHALTLHNQVQVNHLPYMPFPPNWPVYIPKDKLANWFEAYVEAMELNFWTATSFESGTYNSAEATLVGGVARRRRQSTHDASTARRDGDRCQRHSESAGIFQR